MSILLHLLILLPIGAAIAILLGAPARFTAVTAGRFNLGISLLALCLFKHDQPGFQF